MGGGNCRNQRRQWIPSTSQITNPGGQGNRSQREIFIFHLNPFDIVGTRSILSNIVVMLWARKYVSGKDCHLSCGHGRIIKYRLNYNISAFKHPRVYYLLITFEGT